MKNYPPSKFLCLHSPPLSRSNHICSVAVTVATQCLQTRVSQRFPARRKNNSLWKTIPPVKFMLAAPSAAKLQHRSTWNFRPIFWQRKCVRPPFWRSLNHHISVKNHPILTKFGVLQQILNLMRFWKALSQYLRCDKVTINEKKQQILMEKLTVYKGM